MFNCAVGAVVLMVHVTAAGSEPFRVTLAGEKEHVASDGSPEQLELLKSNVPVNPLIGVMLKVTFALWPCTTDRELACGENVNVGSPELSITVAILFRSTEPR